LADHVADPEVREQLLAVDTRRHTALLLHGVCEIEDIRVADVHEAPHDDGMGKHRLYLEARAIETSLGSVVLLERLPMTPDAVTVDSPWGSSAQLSSAARLPKTPDPEYDRMLRRTRDEGTTK
jgi:hypothetical protein